MKRCTLCEKTYCFNYGLKGENADSTKLLIVLHRADKRINEYLRGYFGALVNSATGRILDNILKETKLDFKDIFLTNFFKCLLPKDRHPTKQEYSNCLEIFEEQIMDFQPKAMVIFGKEPYQHIFPEESRRTLIGNLDHELTYQGIPSLVSIHPSQIWKKRNPELQKPYIETIAKFIRKQINS